CPDQATLQTWIVEGRIQRDDEINGGGDSWRRLGDSRVLAGFFEAFDSAQLADEITEREKRLIPKNGKPVRMKRFDTGEWMKRGERSKRRVNPRAFDELGLSDNTTDDPDADRIVLRFRARRAARSLFVSLLGLCLLAVAVGYIFA